MKDRKKAIVIGSGSIAQNCLLSLIKSDFETYVFEFSKENVSNLALFCKRIGINYALFNDKTQLINAFLEIDQKTLVVSASNRFLFPKNVIQNEYLEIINYHSSLLPKYPGRNAEAWSIYEGEQVSGITWHKVTIEVDSGDIIIQSDARITENTTSFSLLKEFNKLAILAFEKIIGDYQNNGIEYFKQLEYKKDNLKYSWMKPNNGILDLSWSEQKISQFLRAYNYGIFKNLGDFEVFGFPNQSKFYEYFIHNKQDFVAKFENYQLIERETKIFELKLDE